MAHPTKKQRPNGGGDYVSLAEETKTADQMMATAPSVGNDVLANIFGYLDGPKDIYRWASSRKYDLTGIYRGAPFYDPYPPVSRKSLDDR
jgi:hypothetical protein